MLEPPIRRDKRGRLIPMRDPLLREMDAMVVSPLAYAGPRPESEACRWRSTRSAGAGSRFARQRAESSSSARPDCSSRLRETCGAGGCGARRPTTDSCSVLERRAVDRRRLGQLARATLSAAGRRGRSPEGHAPARSVRQLPEPADRRGCRHRRDRAGARPLACDVPEVLRASVRGVQGTSVVPRSRLSARPEGGGGRHGTVSVPWRRRGRRRFSVWAVGNSGR